MTWTPERHQAAKQRCEKATPGPWWLDTEAPLCPVVFTMADCAEGGEVAEYLVRRGYIKAADEYPRGENRPVESMEFIAAARTDLPDALAEIERLQEVLRVILDPSFDVYDVKRVACEALQSQEVHS